MKPLEPTLLAIFEAEQREHIDRIRALLPAAVDGPAEKVAAVLEELLRRAHTLKGAARAVGIPRIEELAHNLENLFARARDGGGRLGAAAPAEVHRTLDAAEDTLASVLEDTGGAAIQPHDANLIRISAESVDEVLRTTAAVLAAAGRERRIARQCAELFATAAEMASTWSRLRASAGRNASGPGGAPPEALEAFGAALGSLVHQARGTAAVARNAAWSLDRLASGLNQSSALIRMTPAATVFGGFRKMVRDLAAAEGKEAEVQTEGLDVQADRLVLQALKDPVMHLLRNAVAHGIGRPEERQAAGMPRTGLVRLRIEKDGDRLKVSVEDDGRGLDLAAIAATARSRGLETAAAPGAEDLARLILRPGFSTAAGLSALAGRGMGLAVVAEAVSRLNGELRFGAGESGGFAIVLLAPVSMTADRVVLVSAAGHTFAFPNHGLERLLRLRPEDIEAGDAGEFVRLDGKPVLLLRLADLLDLAAPPGPGPDSTPTRPACPAAVLKAGEQRLAVAVDALLEEREVLVRDLGLPPAWSGLAAGAVPLEEGAVAVVLSAAALIKRGHQAGGERAPLRSVSASAPAPARILVVDDSITTRSLERSILEAHGYQVRLAVDGVEALDQLEREPADLVIADVAMPRMDGFEMLERMKANQRLARIPVIMVTSMEKREDQERGLGLGADAYIIKRKFDQRELLATVRQIL